LLFNNTVKVNCTHVDGGVGTTWQSSFSSHGCWLHCWMPMRAKSFTVHVGQPFFKV
jgi:hypothetical protein